MSELPNELSKVGSVGIAIRSQSAGTSDNDEIIKSLLSDLRVENSIILSNYKGSAQTAQSAPPLVDNNTSRSTPVSTDCIDPALLAIDNGIDNSENDTGNNDNQVPESLITKNDIDFSSNSDILDIVNCNDSSGGNEINKLFEDFEMNLNLDANDNDELFNSLEALNNNNNSSFDEINFEKFKIRANNEVQELNYFKSDLKQKFSINKESSINDEVDCFEGDDYFLKSEEINSFIADIENEDRKGTENGHNSFRLITAESLIEDEIFDNTNFNEVNSFELNKPLKNPEDLNDAKEIKDEKIQIFDSFGLKSNDEFEPLHDERNIVDDFLIDESDVIKQGIAQQDDATEAENIFQEGTKDQTEVLTVNQYNYSSGILVENQNAPQTAYTENSMIDLIKNEFRTEYISTTALAYENPNYYENVSKGYWIESLDKALENDDFFNEFEVFNKEIDLISQSIPLNHLKINADGAILGTDTASVDEQQLIEPKSSNSLHSTTEKPNGLFQKISARVLSASTQYFKSSTNKLVNEEIEIKVDGLGTKLKDHKQETSIETPDVETNSPGLIPKQQIDGISEPGTLTAKLYEENGLTKLVTKEDLHFDESHFIEKNGNTGKTDIEAQDLHEKSIEASLLGDFKQEPEDDNVWKVNNRFLANRSRHKKVSKIFKSNKDSAEHGVFENNNSDLSDGYNDCSSDQVLEQPKEKLSWRKSLMRSSTFTRKKRIKSDFSLDSGKSLQGYAAEYADEELKLPKSSEILSNEAEDVQKIINSKNFNYNDTTIHSRVIGANSSTEELDKEMTLNTSIAPSTNDSISTLLVAKLGTSRTLTEYIPTPLPTSNTTKRKERAAHFIKERLNFWSKKPKHFDDDLYDYNENSKNDESESEKDVKSNVRKRTIRFAPSPQYFENDKPRRRFSMSFLHSFSHFNSSNDKITDDDEDEEKEKLPISGLYKSKSLSRKTILKKWA